MRIYSNRNNTVRKSRKIYGAEGDLEPASRDMFLDDLDDEEATEDEDTEDTEDDSDVKSIDDEEYPFGEEQIQTPVAIDVDNNIDNHFIAECDICKGVFISPVIKSDSDVQSIQGICPLCNNESTQYLKWVINPIEDAQQ